MFAKYYKAPYSAIMKVTNNYYLDMDTKMKKLPKNVRTDKSKT